jgi:endonuclease/exonuclease/phosphatase (EEP) superfamily protein YafD
MRPGPDLRRAGAVLCWAAVAVLVAWTIVRAFGLEGGFPVVPLIAYTPLVGLGAVLVLVTAALLRLWVAAGLAGAVAVVLAILVLPRAFPNDQSGLPSDGPRLRVLTANLRLGGADPEAVVDLVRDEEIDLLALQELTTREDQALRDAGLADLLPERAVFAREGSRGSGLYARWPLTHVYSLTLTDSDRSFAMPGAGVRLPGGEGVELVDVHTVAPTASGAVSAWEEGLETLPSAEADGRSRLLLGDFNATLDHAALRDVLDRGYVDAADVAGKGLTPTWPTNRRLPATVTIDHILVDRGVRVEDVSVHDLPGSDHRALSAELVLPAPASRSRRRSP